MMDLLKKIEGWDGVFHLPKPLPLMIILERLKWFQIKKLSFKKKKIMGGIQVMKSNMLMTQSF